MPSAESWGGKTEKKAFFGRWKRWSYFAMLMITWWYIKFIYMHLCWYDHLTMMRYIRCNRWPGLGLGSGQRANALQPGNKMQIFWWKADKGFPNCRAINQNPKWANSGAPHRNATHKQAFFTHRRRMHCHLSAILKPTLKVTFFLILYEKQKSN